MQEEIAINEDSLDVILGETSDGGDSVAISDSASSGQTSPEPGDPQGAGGDDERESAGAPDEELPTDGDVTTDDDTTNDDDDTTNVLREPVTRGVTEKNDSGGCSVGSGASASAWWALLLALPWGRRRFSRA
jgi:MYXO-CTERM domain-containing protein